MKNIQWTHLESNFGGEGFINEDDDFDDLGSVYDELIFTPMGTFHKRDMMNPMMHFDFWIGETDFRITNEDKLVIQDVEGVELFYQWTPYKIIIAPARMFSSAEVKKNIENVLIDGDILTIDSFVINDENTQEQVITEFSKALDIDFRYWVLYAYKVDNEVVCTYIGCNNDNSQKFKNTLDTCELENLSYSNISASVAKNDFYKKDTP